MSKLGHITKSYGNQLNFAIANTNGDNIMNSILPPNTIILNSQIDKYNNDTEIMNEISEYLDMIDMKIVEPELATENNEITEEDEENVS